MSKITFNDLPAAVEALLLRMDILHDLVKSTRDTLNKLIDDSGDSSLTRKSPGEISLQQTLPEGEQLLDIGKAARYLRITNQQLYMAVERSQIAHFRKLNQIYFKIADLQFYKENQPKSIATEPAKPMLDEPTLVLGENDNNLLSMEEAVEYTGFKKNYLYSFVKSRKVPFLKKGRRLYFPLVALNQIMIMSTEKQPGRGRGKK
jgi:hypothetical protein